MKEKKTDLSHYYDLDGKACFVQLREPVLICTPDLAPGMQEVPAEDGPEGSVTVQPAYMPHLKCYVKVRPDIGPDGAPDIMFEMVGHFTGSAALKWRIFMPRAMVSYITVVEESVIATPS